MPRIALTLTFAMMAAIHGAALAAQEAPGPGSVVRVYVPPPGASPLRPVAPSDLVEGRVIALDSTRLILVRDEGDTLTVPMVTIKQLYLRGKRSSQIREGASVGLLVGGIVGALIGSQRPVIVGCDASECGGEYGPGPWADTTTQAIEGFKNGALVGAIAGAILGATFKSYHWTPVRTDQLHLGVLPAGRGMRLGFSASF